MKQATAGTTGFTTSQEVRVSRAARNRSMNGVHFEKWVKKNDLVGDWEGADPTKCYAGVVPVIGGAERYDLALTSFDLCQAAVVDFTKSVDAGEVFNLDCPLRKAAMTALSKSGCTYDTLLDAVCAVFPNGGTMSIIEYTAKTRKGGQWRNALLSAKA